ncbi:MAG: hypothetical protein ACQPRH_04100 [Solitalea-like symbiont of Tyrophagus putrescentiae]
MKKKVVGIAIIALSLVSSIKFVETRNLKQSDVFGSTNFYTDNKLFVESLKGYDKLKSNFFGEFVQEILANENFYRVTNIAVGFGSTIFVGLGCASNMEYNMNNISQNIAMAGLD